MRPVLPRNRCHNLQYLPARNYRPFPPSRRCRRRRRPRPRPLDFVVRIHRACLRNSRVAEDESAWSPSSPSSSPSNLLRSSPHPPKSPLHPPSAAPQIRTYSSPSMRPPKPVTSLHPAGTNVNSSPSTRPPRCSPYRHAHLHRPAPAQRHSHPTTPSPSSASKLNPRRPACSTRNTSSASGHEDARPQPPVRTPAGSTWPSACACVHMCM